MPTARPHFFDLDPAQWRELCTAMGLAPYRAQQVMEWVYQHHVADPQRMTNLPARDRATLARHVDFTLSHIVRHQHATDGTQKLLLQWPPPEPPPLVAPPPVADAASPPVTTTPEHPLPVVADPVVSESRYQTECVMIPAERGEDHKARHTACVSSQIGCPVGCRFCASGLGGLDGNLTTGMIVEQVWRLGTLEGVPRISNVVFMGMGEPLANFAAVTGAIRTLMAPWGLGISGRRLTVSTVGLPAPMRRLADLDLPVTLALSLHAPNDALRRQIIPWAQFVSIDQLLDTGRYYFDRTGREITLEYILLGGVNDQPAHAHELAQVAATLRANVNLIRFNEVAGIAYTRPQDTDVRRFQDILRQAGINTHIRASRGRDIAAACGQLRHEQGQGMANG